MRWRFLLIPLLLAGGLSGCTGVQATAPRNPEDAEFASEAECRRAMDNVYDVYAQSSEVAISRKEMFDRTEHERQQRARVERCTITLTKRDTACLSTARDIQDVGNCQRWE